MIDFILWVFKNIGMAFYNLGYALLYPRDWLLWLGSIGDKLTDPDAKTSLMKFIYYGGSKEFFFVIFTTFLVFTIIGLFWRDFLWGCVRVLEGFANAIGRFFAWAGLIMVLQQILIIFMQRIFAQSQITLGFGMPVTFDISWWAEELKLYNALVVALCVSYTFVQGSHVRVDLIYAPISFRAKRVIDMVGSLIFMMPVAVLTWLYGWYFLWRHVVVPNPSASDTLERLLTKSRGLRWNLETIGFSPNGFNAYFLFKILLIAFTALVFIQAVAFFWRSYLEWKEGPESAGKYLDKDKLGDADADLVADIH